MALYYVLYLTRTVQQESAKVVDSLDYRGYQLLDAANGFFQWNAKKSRGNKGWKTIPLVVIDKYGKNIYQVNDKYTGTDIEVFITQFKILIDA